MEMLDSIRALRKQIGDTMSYMEVLRHAVRSEAQRFGQPHFPLALTDVQKKFIDSNLEQVEHFLETEDGRDACALLVEAFREFVEYDLPEEEAEK